MTTSSSTTIDTLFAQSWEYLNERALQTAVELGIPDLVADAPVPLAVLAEATGSQPDALKRMLRPLVSGGVLGLTDEGAYARTEKSAVLESGHPESLRSWYRLMYRITYRMLDDPMVTLRTGRPSFESRFGNTYFGHFAENPEDGAIFNGAMVSFTQRTARAVAAAYDFGDAGEIVDIGGGLGHLLAEILTRHPGATGTVFDLPQLAEDARKALDAAGLEERAAVKSGDFFSAVPSAGTHLLSWILHDWDDEQALAILRECRRAQSDADGRLLIVEAVLPEEPEPGLAASLDMVMLFGLGGRERTEAEYAALLDQAGYEHTSTLALDGPGLYIIEARPR
ncbi:methyltransferase [Streptomyces inusitatus]|uniref:Methyltransferase n=1 Tax=Streptomyces inusitatus TaxID=68221 RepID=A0A918PYR1_9ACTN|nr:methyltransferase [Streptomyces inusitatus]GGZ26467.1 methyltransferase [Streptomyces inusitatus]